MLKKKERLDRVTFNRFFSMARRLHSPSLMLLYVPHVPFKASAVISKKVTTSAVQRNTFRRRVYAILRRLHAHTPLQGAFICIAKSGAKHIEYSALEQELVGLIHKTNVLR